MFVKYFSTPDIFKEMYSFCRNLAIFTWLPPNACEWEHWRGDWWLPRSRWRGSFLSSSSGRRSPICHLFLGFFWLFHLKLGRRKRGGVGCQGVQHCLLAPKTFAGFFILFLQHWVGFQKLRRSKLSTLPILVLVWIWFQAPSMQQRVPCVSWETEQVAWIICHLYLLLSLMAFRAPHSQCTARFCGSRPHPCC